MVDLARKGSILPAIVLIHIPLTIAIVMAASMRIWPRYFFIDIGFLCLFLVHGAFVLGRVRGPPRRRAPRVDAERAGRGHRASPSAGIVASVALLPRNYLYPKQDLLGARDFVEAQRTAESAVVTLGLTSRPYADYYAPQWQAVSSLPELKAIAQSRSAGLARVFLSRGHRTPASRHRGVRRRAHFDRVRRFPGTLGGGDVLVFRTKPKQGPATPR